MKDGEKKDTDREREREREREKRKKKRKGSEKCKLTKENEEMMWK